MFLKLIDDYVHSRKDPLRAKERSELQRPPNLSGSEDRRLPTPQSPRQRHRLGMAMEPKILRYRWVGNRGLMALGTQRRY